MNRKTIYLLVGFVVSVVLISVTGGVVSAGDKIGIIDLDRIIQNPLVAKSTRAMFLMDIEAKKGVLKSKEQEIRDMENNIGHPENDKKEGDSNERQDKIAHAVTELRRLRDDMEEELKRKERELQQQILKEIEALVQEYKKIEKFTLILEKRFVYAFDEAIDITDQIITLYDARQK